VQRTKYLEIYPSEVAARKISKHLDKMAEIRPRVYRKTLLRYRKLAYILIECITKIVRMLQSEMLLSSEDAEFQELVSDFDIEQIDELRDSVDALGNLIEKQPSQDIKKLTADTVKLYKSIFEQAAHTNFGYVEVNECAKLLNHWIIRRFSGYNPNFRYQIKQIPIWATFIVIAYGKYHSLGQTRQFSEEFIEWCDDLDSDNNNCWALPYSVFNMMKVLNSDNFTADAIVIYDILIEKCLYQLLDGAKNVKAPMDSSYIVSLAKEHRPELSHMIKTRFTKQAELIESLSLCPADDSEEEV
jgi:hypothetical protein